MPVVNIKMVKGRTVEQKRNLVRAVTDAVAQTIDVKPDAVWVLIEEYEKENWAAGGELFSDSKARAPK
ncbi:MAG: 4-oxalocrotonate tautomerase [Deltaproteobacteria bacterium HGW-Deltaproteobacteria-9]|jgi:4-oxalocrotonate tautomerase|nr:MAG: 4-oxalocrotonate tautomerase [Deltaproteobacteria bacterium HGW-Deltaproteobacteria-9]